MTHTLDRAIFWKLRSLCADTRAAREALAAAQQRQNAALADLGIDPKTPQFALDDEALTLTIPDAPTP